jgi:glycerol-3-phosphate O-acyltransferase
MQTEKLPSIFPNHFIPGAIQELLHTERFSAGMKNFLPEPFYNTLISDLDGVKTVEDFQSKIIYKVVKFIEKNSIKSLTVSGLEHLNPQKKHLFISNHRDIVLDSAFLNTTLFENGFSTSQIAIGDNLMKHRISELIFRMNKSFVVRRSGSPVELYHYSVLLSEHIHRAITEGIDNVWIAQREGRAKNGDDRTQTGVLKMLSLCNKADMKGFFQSLNVTPVSISYEFIPCDLLNTKEYLEKLVNPDYKKTFEEDLRHMLLGLTGAKGRVHFHFGKPLQAELEVFDDLKNGKRQLEALAAMIDNAIHQHYQLHPIHSVAYNLLNGTQVYDPACTPAEIERLTTFFKDKHEQLQQDPDQLGWRYLLGMYANPLINKKL